MKYRSKNDIKYLDFIAFTEAIEGMETDLVYDRQSGRRDNQLVSEA